VDTPKGSAKADAPKAGAKADDSKAADVDAPKGSVKADEAKAADVDAPKAGAKVDTPKPGAKPDAPKGSAKADAPNGSAKADAPNGSAKADTPPGAADVDTPANAYLDDTRVIQSQVGYGSLGLHGEMGYEGGHVKLGGTAYSHAISMHPPARGRAFADFAVSAPYKRFKAIAGIADSASPHPSRMLVFRVKAGDATLFESAPMSGTGAHVPVDIALGSDVHGLRLEVEVQQRNTERTCNLQHANVKEHAIRNMQRASNIQCATYNVQHAVCAGFRRTAWLWHDATSPCSRRGPSCSRLAHAPCQRCPLVAGARKQRVRPWSLR
jgi:hypothetical protein